MWAEVYETHWWEHKQPFLNFLVHHVKLYGLPQKYKSDLPTKFRFRPKLDDYNQAFH